MDPEIFEPETDIMGHCHLNFDSSDFTLGASLYTLASQNQDTYQTKLNSPYDVFFHLYCSRKFLLFYVIFARCVHRATHFMKSYASLIPFTYFRCRRVKFLGSGDLNYFFYCIIIRFDLIRLTLNDNKIS